VQRLKEWGDEIRRRFGSPLAETSGKGNRLIVKLAKKARINHIILQEDIAQGERVRAFVLEGKTSSGWKRIFEGSVIGHKFIHAFEEMEVSAVRLTIAASKGEAYIKNLSVYHVE
jgi:hypothetical protein